MTTLTGSVLLYNASFEPLGRVSFKHAVKMLVREVAAEGVGLPDELPSIPLCSEEERRNGRVPAFAGLVVELGDDAGEGMERQRKP